MGEQHATHPSAPQQTARDERLHQLSALVTRLLLALVAGLVITRVAVLVQQAGDDRAAKPPILQCATAQRQSCKVLGFLCGRRHPSTSQCDEALPNSTILCHCAAVSAPSPPACL